jgi:hypothetical protein
MQLFNEDSRYTEDALKLDREINDALMDIFRKWIDKGYSVREIGHIVGLAVWDVELHYVLFQRGFE